MANKKRIFGKRNQGFTLVELLVVISIIAILGAVAFPALTGALKKAREAAATETGRGLALSMFQYASDNNQVFPAAATSTLLFNGLTAAYIKNTDALWISGAGGAKYAGAVNPTALAAANVSWDVTVRDNANGLTANDPDQVPLIISMGSNIAYPGVGANGAAMSTIAAAGNNPFGTDGVAVGYKDCSASFSVNKGLANAPFPISSASLVPAYAYLQVKP